MNIKEYFDKIRLQVDKVYSICGEAKKNRGDVSNFIEVDIAATMAEKVVSLISTLYEQVRDVGIEKRIIELEKSYGKLNPTVMFKIAEEVAKQKFCNFASLIDAVDCGIRIGFAYYTLGVVSCPIEGYTGIKIRKTNTGEYIEAFFSGPIRAAGTTGECMVLILIDYLRELFGFEKYQATEDEIKRYVIENYDYHERVSNLQYLPTKEEIEFLAKKIPIQISGEPTSLREVSNYKNLARVETNRIRGGMCLVFSEGLAQKAAKGLRLLKLAKQNGINSTGFDFLEGYVDLHKNKKEIKGSDVVTYMQDIVAGRPVFSFPSRSGGFRFRYGRSRTNGFSAVGLSPATMSVVNDFIAEGTQLKLEKPTKGGVVTSCDFIEGPIVKLKDGSVKKLKNKQEVKNVLQDVDEIIYLGDILFPLSDVVNRNFNLLRAGYVEEWWNLELEKVGGKVDDYYNVELDVAVKLSREYKIPLYPKYIFYWTEISKEQFENLLKWIQKSKVVDGKIQLILSKDFDLGKRGLELLGVEHEVVGEKIVFSEEVYNSLLLNLGIEVREDDVIIKDFNLDKNILEIINDLSDFIIKDKSGSFVGARMGRPEKAKLRKISGGPHVLFGLGAHNNRYNNFDLIKEQGKIRNIFPNYFCKKCGIETIYNFCERCASPTNKQFYFRDTGDKLEIKERDGIIGTSFSLKDIDINYYLKIAQKRLNIEDVVGVQGVGQVDSKEKDVENIEKGILRKKYNLHVNKDGTIRYDGIELPLVSFKAKEIGVSVEKLKELGYVKDIDGNDLVDEEQILELMPHDILLPSFDEINNEKADDVFVNVGNFVDEELEKFYGVDRFYNFKSRDDLIGQLGVCMAPHNCAGVVCRFIGFSKVQGIFASPFMHAAIRRDCDGDEMSIMLLGDVLLNFSKKFLSGRRGSVQDAPLVLNIKIDAGEVDDQILDFEYIDKSYPLELYKLAEKEKHSSEIKDVVFCRDVLNSNKNCFSGIGFTHDTSDLNNGVLCSSYKSLGTMWEKVLSQMDLAKKIRAVDEREVAEMIINKHFLKDIKGNLRRFSMQTFRCTSCGAINRRTPLSGVCFKCKGNLVLTVSEASIRKYLEPAIKLAEMFDVDDYVKQDLELTKRAIDSYFSEME